MTYSFVGHLVVKRISSQLSAGKHEGESVYVCIDGFIKLEAAARVSMAFLDFRPGDHICVRPYGVMGYTHHAIFAEHGEGKMGWVIHFSSPSGGSPDKPPDKRAHSSSGLLGGALLAASAVALGPAAVAARIEKRRGWASERLDV